MHLPKRILVYSVAILVLSLLADSRNHRHRRIVSDSSEELDLKPTPPCKDICGAQWKAEYQMHFGKLYDSNYYDIPLDHIVIGNKTTLNLFCSATDQKFYCYRNECLISNRSLWTPDYHICITHLTDFRENIGCLSKTSNIITEGCIDVCNNVIARLNSHENAHLTSMRLEQDAAAEYIQQNQNCHIVACHQKCHKAVIEKVCKPHEISDSQKVVDDYYQRYLQHDIKVMRDTKNGHLLSSFCRRITEGENENQPVPNMTRYNEIVLSNMDLKIAEMISYIKHF